MKQREVTRVRQGEHGPLRGLSGPAMAIVVCVLLLLTRRLAETAALTSEAHWVGWHVVVVAVCAAMAASGQRIGCGVAAVMLGVLLAAVPAVVCVAALLLSELLFSLGVMLLFAMVWWLIAHLGMAGLRVAAARRLRGRLQELARLERLLPDVPASDGDAQGWEARAARLRERWARRPRGVREAWLLERLDDDGWSPAEVDAMVGPDGGPPGGNPPFAARLSAARRLRDALDAAPPQSYDAWPYTRALWGCHLALEEAHAPQQWHDLLGLIAGAATEDVRTRGLQVLQTMLFGARTRRHGVGADGLNREHLRRHLAAAATLVDPQERVDLVFGALLLHAEREPVPEATALVEQLVAARDDAAWAAFAQRGESFPHLLPDDHALKPMVLWCLLSASAEGGLPTPWCDEGRAPTRAESLRWLAHLLARLAAQPRLAHRANRDLVDEALRVLLADVAERGRARSEG